MYFCVVPVSSLTRKMTKHISPSLVASLPFHQDRQALLTYSDVVLPPSAFLTLSLLQTFKTYSNKQTLKKNWKDKAKSQQGNKRAWIVWLTKMLETAEESCWSGSLALSGGSFSYAGRTNSMPFIGHPPVPSCYQTYFIWITTHLEFSASGCSSGSLQRN
jgi:hypothetical protein